MGVLADGLGRYLSSVQQARLGAARVGVAGAGGLGSNVALLLVRTGIRSLVLVDGDVVEASNLNRQQYFPADIGLPKVDALAARLRELEPDLALETYRKWLTKGDAPAIFAGCDVVVEALDDPEAKARICAELLQAGHMVVAASGLGGWGGNPPESRRLGRSLVCVGDFVSAVGPHCPPLAPRVTAVAALQADAVIHHVLATPQQRACDPHRQGD